MKKVYMIKDKLVGFLPNIIVEPDDGLAIHNFGLSLLSDMPETVRYEDFELYHVADYYESSGIKSIENRFVIDGIFAYDYIQDRIENYNSTFKKQGDENGTPHRT